MIVSFTGTQRGMTELQKIAVDEWLSHLQPEEFHHGDCIGADEDAHNIAAALGIKTVAHPGTDRRGESPKRAGCAADVVLPPAPYLERNAHMVDAGDVLLATPAEMEEQVRSGTWSTVRKMRKRGKDLIIIYPDGSEEVDKRSSSAEAIVDDLLDVKETMP